MTWLSIFNFRVRTKSSVKRMNLQYNNFLFFLFSFALSVICLFLRDKGNSKKINRMKKEPKQIFSIK